MALLIRPVKLNKSVYIRVPNDLADLIGLTKKDEFNLSFQEAEGEFRLTYSIRKREANLPEQKITPPIMTATR